MTKAQRAVAWVMIFLFFPLSMIPAVVYARQLRGEDDDEEE